MGDLRREVDSVDYAGRSSQQKSSAPNNSAAEKFLSSNSSGKNDYLDI